MVKVQIVVDEKKLIGKTKHEVEQMWKLVDDLFIWRGMKKASLGTYECEDNVEGRKTVWWNLFWLMGLDWFVDITTSIRYVNSDHNDGFPEELYDMLRGLHSQYAGVGFF